MLLWLVIRILLVVLLILPIHLFLKCWTVLKIWNVVAMDTFGECWELGEIAFDFILSPFLHQHSPCLHKFNFRLISQCLLSLLELSVILHSLICLETDPAVFIYLYSFWCINVVVTTKFLKSLFIRLLQFFILLLFKLLTCSNGWSFIVIQVQVLLLLLNWVIIC